MIHVEQVGDEMIATDDNGDVIACICKTPWGKYKIVGEDTYSWSLDDLVKRLEKRP